ncbi:MAG: Gfo/Idh/MocA family oxidoreductase [Candidatus Bathyarchaeia archaeon]
MGKKVGIGVIGSGFVADIHASAFRRCSDCEIVATASPTLNHVKAFALKHGIKQYSTDYRDLLKLDAIEVVSVGVPNHLHAKICIEAAEAGKHVIMEKPFAMNLREADQMISACRRYGVKLMYA